MLDYPVAIVVAYLYASITDPDREAVPTEIAQSENGGIEYFTCGLKQQKMLLSIWVSNGLVNVYSKARKRPIEKELALDLIAQKKTDDLLIYGHDLLSGGRYPADLLPSVVDNANIIIRNYASELAPALQINRVAPLIPQSPNGESKTQIWTAKALAIANDIALSRYNSGVREITARNISEAVASELAKDPSTHGTRGLRSAGNIRNEALKGWKFIPPTGTNGTNGTKK